MAGYAMYRYMKSPQIAVRRYNTVQIPIIFASCIVYVHISSYDTNLKIHLILVKQTIIAKIGVDLGGGGVSKTCLGEGTPKQNNGTWGTPDWDVSECTERYEMHPV